MTLLRSCGVWAAALAACMLAACGGSGEVDGIDGTGHQEVVSYGRLVGFGSIEVNGVHFDAAGAAFVIDGAVGSQSDLGLGDIVFVEGRIEAGASRAVARRVVSDRVLWGRIDDIDIDSRSIAALGQVVRVSEGTFFGAGIAGGLSSLSRGDTIRVSGFRNAYGAIVATRIERQATGTAVFRTTGALTAFDGASKRLQINGLVVDFSGAALSPPDAAGALAPGVFVEVQADAAPVGAVLTATVVEVKRDRLPGDAAARATVEGYVTAVDAGDGTRFHVDGLPVTFTASTTGDEALKIDASITVGGAVGPAGVVAAREIVTSPSLPAGRVAVDGRVFDAHTGPVEGAQIDIWVQTSGGLGYSATWSRGGTVLMSGTDGRFTTDVPPGSLLIVVAYKAMHVQPCAVVREVSAQLAFDIELVAESTLDAFNPPPPVTSVGANTVSGLVYEQTESGRLPIAGTRLWFGDAMGIAYATTVTDRDGRYLACNLPNHPLWRGSTDIWAQAFGYGDTVIEGIDSSGTTVIDVEMRRP
jgi:hypothetical protein